MADVKRPGALKEILDLANGLANRMAIISLRLEVGVDPRGERQLLEHWRAAHLAVSVAHGELGRLADALAQSASAEVHIEGEKGEHDGMDG